MSRRYRLGYFSDEWEHAAVNTGMTNVASHFYSHIGIVSQAVPEAISGFIGGIWEPGFKGIQESFELWISESRCWIPDSLTVELGFPIPIVSGIHDSLSSIPDSKDQDFRFHGKNLLDSGILIPLRWCYTRRFATTSFSATQRCNIVATLCLHSAVHIHDFHTFKTSVTTLFQHCKALLR